MPLSLRHHVFSKERLMAFSDAVFAIIATIMVIPLKIPDTVAEETDFDLKGYIGNPDFALDVTIYYLAFYLVMDAWFSHCRVFNLLEYVDDLITFLNLLALFFISLLPASIVLVSSYPDDNIAITIACVNIILINSGMAVMVYFAVRQRSMLSPLITERIGIGTIKWTMYIPLLINPVLAVLVIIFINSLPHIPLIGQVTLFSIVPFNFVARHITRRIQACYLRRKVVHTSSEIDHFLCLIKNIASKERILALSDGVFSIIGTLIVLDLTSDIHKKFSGFNGAVELIKEEKYAFFSYFSSFMITGLLWFIHHSMFNLIVKVNGWITYFNTLSLMFLGLIPFGAGVVSQFVDGANTDNEIASVRVLVVLMILASLTQLALWSVAHCEKSKCLSPEVDHHMVELIQLWKLLIFPLVGLLVYFVSFSSGVTLNHFYTYSTFAIPVLFVLPRAMIYTISRIRSLHKGRSKSDRPTSMRYSKIQIQQEPPDSGPVLYTEKGYLTTETFKELSSEDGSNTNSGTL